MVGPRLELGAEPGGVALRGARADEGAGRRREADLALGQSLSPFRFHFAFLEQRSQVMQEDLGEEGDGAQHEPLVLELLGDGTLEQIESNMRRKGTIDQVAEDVWEQAREY